MIPPVELLQQIGAGVLAPTNHLSLLNQITKEATRGNIMNIEKRPGKFRAYLILIPIILEELVQLLVLLRLHPFCFGCYQLYVQYVR